MSTTEDRIASLYGSSQAPEDDHTGATNTDPVAETLYPPEPDAVKNPYVLDGDSMEHRLYGTSNSTQLAGDTVEELRVFAGDDNEHEVLTQNIGFMASEAGANAQDVHSLVTLANSYAYENGQQTANDTRQLLAQEFGNVELVAKLEDAQTLVRSFPDFAAWLTNTGAGNDPSIVRKLIQISSSPRAQARIQQLRRGGK